MPKYDGCDPPSKASSTRWNMVGQVGGAERQRTSGTTLIPSGFYGLRLEQSQVQAVPLVNDSLIVWSHENGPVVSAGTCPHAGAYLGSGTLDNGQLVCPFHHFRFDRDGACLIQGFPKLRVLPSATWGQHVMFGVALVPELAAVPKLEAQTVNWKQIETVEMTVSATVEDLLINVLDVDHFTPVHRSSRPPEITHLQTRREVFEVETRHFIGEGTILPMRLRAHGPGVIQSWFGNVPLVRITAFHLPISKSKTKVSAIIEARSSALRRPGSTAVIAPLAAMLRRELGEDEKIWVDRDPTVDNRSSASIRRLKTWLQNRDKASVPLTSRDHDGERDGATS